MEEEEESEESWMRRESDDREYGKGNERERMGRKTRLRIGKGENKMRKGEKNR